MASAMSVSPRTAEERKIFKLIMDRTVKSLKPKVQDRSRRIRASRAARKQYLKSIRQGAAAKIKSIRMNNRTIDKVNKLKIRSDKARARARAHTLRYMTLETKRLELLRNIPHTARYKTDK